MPSSLKDMHAQVMKYLKQGKFAEGIEDIYAGKAMAQENAKLATGGRTTKANIERAFEKKRRKYYGIEVRVTPIDRQGGGNGTVFYETLIQWVSVRYRPRNGKRSRV